MFPGFQTLRGKGKLLGRCGSLGIESGSATFGAGPLHAGYGFGVISDIQVTSTSAELEEAGMLLRVVDPAFCRFRQLCLHGRALGHERVAHARLV